MQVDECRDPTPARPPDPFRECFDSDSADLALLAFGTWPPAATHLKAATIPIKAGPNKTMKSVGRMHSMSGKMTFTGICIAFSSAR